MILWAILFILVLVISYILAAKSMRDFAEVPSIQEHGLFLIKKRTGLNQQLLQLIHQDLQKSRSIISFERLFKGSESALVVFGPKKLLSKYNSNLDLLELEDYTNVDEGNVAGWEISTRDSHKEDISQKETAAPLLNQEEQFWWQVILWVEKGKSQASGLFKTQVRCLVITPNEERKKNLTQILAELPENAVKLPKAFSNKQLLDLYIKRSYQKNYKKTYLSSKDILKFLWL